MGPGLGTVAVTLALGSTTPVAAAHVVAAAGASHASQACANASLTATARNLSQVSAGVFCLIDQQRREHRLSPFARNSQLDQSASFQSHDMVVHHYFAHDHPGRPRLLNRILWTGYFAYAVTGLYAENLGYGPQQATTPAVIVNAWMGSPDHRANILDPRLRDVGIGTALAPPDPAFYPDYPSLVLATDFGMRTFAHARCGAPPATRRQSDAGAVRPQPVCAARTTSR